MKQLANNITVLLVIPIPSQTEITQLQELLMAWIWHSFVTVSNRKSKTHALDYRSGTVVKSNSIFQYFWKGVIRVSGIYKNITSSFKAHSINTANTATIQACYIAKKMVLDLLSLPSIYPTQYRKKRQNSKHLNQ